MKWKKNWVWSITLFYYPRKYQNRIFGHARWDLGNICRECSYIVPAFPSAPLYVPLRFPICRKVCHHIVYKQILYANSKLRTRKIKNWNLKELHPRGLQRNGDAIVVYMWKKPREGSTPQTHLCLGHNPLRTPPLGKTSKKSNFLFRCRYFTF